MYKQVESVMSNAEFEEHFSPPYSVRKLQGPNKSYCQSVYIFATISIFSDHFYTYRWSKSVLGPRWEFFQAIRDGRSSIITGQIDHFTKNEIQMKNGKHMEADLVMLATGMNIQSNFPFSTIKVWLSYSIYIIIEWIGPNYNCLLHRRQSFVKTSTKILRWAVTLMEHFLEESALLKLW